MKYTVYAYGAITRFEAGVIFKANKTNKIKVLPETISTLYGLAKEGIYMAQRSYNQDRLYYDRLYKATEYILEENYEEAQYELDCWQNDCIKRASKKSSFYKYQK